MQAGVLQRIGRALRGDASLYQRAASDRTLTREILLLLLAAQVLSGIGFATSMAHDEAFTSSDGIGTIALILLLLAGPLCLLVIEASFSGAVVLASKAIGGSGTIWGVFRACAYAWLPNALDIFVAVPVLGDVCWWVGGLWSIVLTVIAVREATATSTGQAIFAFAMPLIVLGVGMAVGAVALAVVVQ